MKKLLFVFVLLLLVCLPVLSQDATAEATVAANPVTVIDGEGATTVEDGGVNVVIESPVTPVAPADPAEPWYAKYLAQIVALAIAVGGLLYGALKAANAWLEGKKTDVAAVSGAEWAYQRSPAWLKTMIVNLIKEFVRLGGNLNEILVEVEDDTAFAVKQAIPKPTTQTTPGGYTQTTPPLP